MVALMVFGVVVLLVDVTVETKTFDNVFVITVVAVQYVVIPDKVYHAFYRLDRALARKDSMNEINAAHRLREAAQERGEAEKTTADAQRPHGRQRRHLQHAVTQFLPGSMQSRIRPLVEYAPDLGVSVWISLVAAGLFILTFESAFREVSRLQAGRSLVSPDQATGLQLALAMQNLSDLQKGFESDHKLEIGLDSATAGLRAIWQESMQLLVERIFPAKALALNEQTFPAFDTVYSGPMPPPAEYRKLLNDVRICKMKLRPLLEQF